MRRFTIAAAVVAGAAALGALGWMSAQLLHLEASENQARLEAAREGAASLALWRMDLALARLVAEEGLRASGAASSTLPVEHVVLHFQRTTGGLWSPEVASGAVPGERLAALSSALGGPLGAAVQQQALAFDEVANAPLKPSKQLSSRQQTDTRLRAQLVQKNVMVTRSKRAPPAPREAPPALREVPSRVVRVPPSMLTPIWRGDDLLLVLDEAEAQGGVVGSILDWPALRGELLSSIRDLLPQARLEPVKEPGLQRPHMLASLPVQLVPGEPADLPEPVRTARTGLYLAWAALAMAALGLGAIAGGAVMLAGRKATFATAVTHELRTPLTTFRLYSEMLEGGMVPPDQVAGYLGTLRGEAERLTHMVENVLAWARVERGRFGALQPMAVREILDREVPRLQEVAGRAGMALEVSAEDVEALAVLGEPTAVGQILFNLVDNACKHACTAADRRIELRLRADGERVRFSVRDHGPGVPPSAARRLFHAFTRPASEAAQSRAPGVGLGLPLSRRLARAMGGGLELVASSEQGAEFELALERVS